MKTHKPITKETSAPETRKEVMGKHADGADCYHADICPLAVTGQRLAAATEGNAPRVPVLVNISRIDQEKGCVDISLQLKQAIELEVMQKEQNWAAYQEALRLLDKAEAQRDELLVQLGRLERIARDTIGADGALIMACDNAQAAITNAEQH